MDDAPVERPATGLPPAVVGLDRSGPPPPQTLSGAPLNLWTIPNAIGYRPPRAAADLPDRRAVVRQRHRRVAGDPLRRHRLERLRRRHRRARHRPVQPLRRAAGPGRRPAARHLRRRSSAGTTSCCRAGRSPCWSPASCSCSSPGSSRCAAACELRINWSGRLACGPGDAVDVLRAWSAWSTAGHVLFYIGAGCSR